VFLFIVGCGDNHTVLILEDGTVYSFGSNDYGQLGHSRSRTRPEKVDGLDAHTIRQVACGSHHTMVLNEWGQVFAWGSNSFGQLGLNVSDQIIHTPKMIKLLATKQVVQIACGQNHSLALTNGESGSSLNELHSLSSYLFPQLENCSHGVPTLTVSWAQGSLGLVKLSP
jgi:alpha-tubulin suppressor-like RCC1 family protein